VGQFDWVIDILMILIIAALTWWIAAQGLFGAAVKFINSMLAGLITFSLYEPLAGWMDVTFGGMWGFADFIAIIVIFLLAFLPLDLFMDYLSPAYVRYHGLVDQIGRFAFAGATAWYFVGMMLCLCQTAPIHKKFLGYQWKSHAVFGFGIDRFWLGFVHHTTDKILEWDNRKVPFDANADFILRYHDHRSFGEPDTTLPGQGGPAGAAPAGGQPAGGQPAGQPAGAQGGGDGGGRPVLPPPGIHVPG
jgi:hypothetical protein